ncbi:MAG TPA: hypothetical protein P5164_12790, partial [Thermoanaerobaculia bacterium]|nr:hypothetical protein [Thermoanaerobaculia bacterium]
MRRRAGDDLELPGVLEVAIPARQVSLVGVPDVLRRPEAREDLLRRREPRLAARVFPLPRRKLEALVDVPGRAELQVRVLHHREERRREADGEAEVDLVALQVPEDVEELRVD